MTYIQDSEQGRLFVVEETVQDIRERLAYMFGHDAEDDHQFGEALYEMGWTIYADTDLTTGRTLKEVIDGNEPLVEIVN